MRKAILILLMVGIVIGLSFAFWQFSRMINYSFSYKSMVQDTVREMVKPESLK